MNAEISTKSNTEKEQEVKSILEDLLSRYKVPLFTSKILVEEKSIPHSHPILTLNTRNTEPLFLLETFIHEQFHWFTVDNKNYDECIIYLKRYSDLGDCNKSGSYPNSFWEHLIVCWNTRNFLQQTLKQEEIDFIYTDWQAYPLTEKFVEDNFELLKEDLEQFKMVYSI
jgi:hypothetical protein